jgi:hypothetical protein
LQERLGVLNDMARESAAAGRAAATKLATTPITINYETGTVDNRLDRGALWGALCDGWDNVQAGLAIMLMLGVSVLPWLAGVLAVVVALKRWGRRVWAVLVGQKAAPSAPAD